MALIEIVSFTGIVTYLIPFILMFTILYGFLSRLNLFSDVSRRINIMLSVFLSLATVVILAAKSFFILWSGIIVIMATGTLFLYTFIHLTGSKMQSSIGKISFTLLMLIAVLWIFNLKGLNLPRNFSEGIIAIIFVAISLIAILWYIFRPQ